MHGKHTARCSTYRETHRYIGLCVDLLWVSCAVILNVRSTITFWSCFVAVEHAVRCNFHMISSGNGNCFPSHCIMFAWLAIFRAAMEWWLVIVLPVGAEKSLAVFYLRDGDVQVWTLVWTGQLILWIFVWAQINFGKDIWTPLSF